MDDDFSFQVYLQGCESVSCKVGLTLCNPIDCSLPGSSSMGFPRQEYWSGLPFPFPGNLPDPGIEPRSSTLQADSLWSGPPELGRHVLTHIHCQLPPSPLCGLIHPTGIFHQVLPAPELPRAHCSVFVGRPMTCSAEIPNGVQKLR